MSDMTFKQFDEANKKRCEASNGFNHLLSEWSTSDWMVAIVGELGEAANIIKKLNRVRDGIPGNDETEEELMAKLRKEMGDAYVYMSLTCQSLGFNLIDAVIDVFNAKSEKIGYKERISD
jgi:NTP pyrophosphatase (non-canonical NTP hydrolase)